VLREEVVPSEGQIYDWIEEVFRQGVRRPGYPADRWAEQWIQDRFREFGLESVRAEPVVTPYWEPLHSSLVAVRADGSEAEIPCFALPFSSPDHVEATLVKLDGGTVQGAIALCELPLLRVPHTWYERIATWQFDPDGSFAEASHLLPTTLPGQQAMESAIAAGACGFVGVLAGYPGNSIEYYVPYDGKFRPIPGVWISGRDGERLKSWLVKGLVVVRLKVDARRASITSYNIVGELPGADDEAVIIGSHHDGPWASAVEDSSGIALVLAQAAYWSRVPPAERPHRLMFLLNGGHMSGGTGQAEFARSHADELNHVVLEVHLEHPASEVSEVGGELRPTGQPETRWWFTSRIPRLESAVRDAIETEDLRRSYILPPTAFREKPTTDAANFYPAGVPIVNYLVAPFYLFDAMDTMDKVHRPSLVPVTRAAIRIINSTAGVSASVMRAGETR
jgi:Peptidase family M28